MHSYPDVGDVVARKYRVVSVLGKGGMGVVLEAINVATGKRVALKWMHPHVSADPVASERLLREAQFATRVRHRNVIDVYDIDRHGPALFLVMEYLEGESFRSYLQKGQATAADLLGLLVGAMRGAAAAHKKGVIHRDVKPENIFLAMAGGESEPTPKLLDFGISKLALLETNQPPLTRDGAMFGTPMYMSYEQLSGVKELDTRTDIYSFGVVLYEALTGRVPYEAQSFPAIIVQIATQTPPPMRKYAPHVPPDLERVVLAALQRDRELRPSSMDAFIDGIEPFVRDPGLRRALVQRPLMTTASAWRNPHDDERSSGAADSFFLRLSNARRRRRVAAAVAAVGALIVSGVLAASPSPVTPALPSPRSASSALHVAAAEEGGHARASAPTPSAAPVESAEADGTPAVVDAGSASATPEFAPARASVPVGLGARPPAAALKAPAAAWKPAAAALKSALPSWRTVAPDAGKRPGEQRRVETPQLSEF